MTDGAEIDRSVLMEGVNRSYTALPRFLKNASAPLTPMYLQEPARRGRSEERDLSTYGGGESHRESTSSRVVEPAPRWSS